MDTTGKKIFVGGPVLPEVMEVLNEASLNIVQSDKTSLTAAELKKYVSGVEGIYCFGQKIPEEIVEAAGPQLKVVSIFSVGVDSIDVNALKKRGIRLGHTPGVLTDAVAEVAVTLMLMCCRKFMQGVQRLKRGEWQHWEAFTNLGVDIRNSTVGIVGLGRIGMGVAKRLPSFGVKKILYYSRRENKEGAKEVNAEYASFDDLLTESDFIVCCCSLNKDSKEMFSYEEFNKMKKTAVFVNIGRGGMVNEDALLDALRNDNIWGAGLDVTTPEPLPVDHPLLHCDNCVVLPHIGSATYQTRLDMGLLAARNLVAGLRGEKMPAEYPL